MDKSMSTILAGFVMFLTGIYIDYLSLLLFNMNISGIDSGPRWIPFFGITLVCPLGIAILMSGFLMQQNVVIGARRFMILFLLSGLMFLLLRSFGLLWLY